MLIPYRDLLAEARAGGYAVGYFEAWDIYSLEAVLDAAEAEGKPIILGFGGVMMEPGWFEDRGMERLGALGLATAKSARVPVSLLLNEVSTFSQVVRGIQAGFNAVMLETSSLPFAENVRLTRKVVEVAHAAGVGVEGELGTLPDATGETDGHESSQTDPEEARRYVSETGIDALSVSIGNVHILTSGKAQIDLDRLAAIHKNVDIPLVIHGGTGFPEEAIPQALALGRRQGQHRHPAQAGFLRRRDQRDQRPAPGAQHPAGDGEPQRNGYPAAGQTADAPSYRPADASLEPCTDWEMSQEAL